MFTFFVRGEEQTQTSVFMPYLQMPKKKGNLTTSPWEEPKRNQAGHCLMYAQSISMLSSILYLYFVGQQDDSHVCTHKKHFLFFGDVFRAIEWNLYIITLEHTCAVDFFLTSLFKEKTLTCLIIYSGVYFADVIDPLAVAVLG